MVKMMAREHKYRVWDKKANKMRYTDGRVEISKWAYDEHISVFVGGGMDAHHHDTDVNLDDAPLMEYTGLKDKNGKGIWEGDILKTKRGVRSVSWGDDIACFECNRKGGSRTLYGYYAEGVEVIGNIYENPELLEEKA